MRIKKTSTTSTLQAQVLNTQSNSQVDTYSCDYIDNMDVYSTEEVKTNKVWLGKPVYKKVINFGDLPSSATSKNVAHGITNIDNVVNIYGFAKNSSASQKYIPLPFASKDASSNIFLTADDTNVTLNVGYDRSSYSAYVILEYTKTN